MSRETSDPSAFIAYISLFPSLADANAMRSPSGDQDGVAPSVRRVRPDPSEFIAYISKFPSL